VCRGVWGHRRGGGLNASLFSMSLIFLRIQILYDNLCGLINVSSDEVWDVVLDLSAPKLLIPENFEDKNAAIIVVDFGKFLLTNQPGDHAPGQSRSFFSFLEKCLLKGLSHEIDF
jgi:hypothetical protein